MGCSRGCYVVLCAMTRESPDPAARRCRRVHAEQLSPTTAHWYFCNFGSPLPQIFSLLPSTKFNHQTSVLGSPNGHDALKRTFSQRRVTTSRSADSSLDPSPPRETQGRFAGRLTRRWPTPLGSQSTASCTRVLVLRRHRQHIVEAGNPLEVGDAQVK